MTTLDDLLEKRVSEEPVTPEEIEQARQLLEQTGGSTGVLEAALSQEGITTLTPQTSLDKQLQLKVNELKTLQGQVAEDSPRFQTLLQEITDIRSQQGVETTSGSDLGFLSTVRDEFVFNPQRRSEIVAEQFGVDPSRVGVLGGDLVILGEDGQIQKLDESLLGNIAGQSPEIAGSVAGSFATKSPAVGSAIGASFGRAVKNLIGSLAFEDPKTPTGVAADIGTEVVFDVAGSGLGKVATLLKNRGTVQGLAGADVQKALKVKDDIKRATDIDLDLAQASDLPALRQLKKWVSKFPGEASEIVRANDEIIEGQIDAAITRIMEVVSKGSDRGRLGKQAIDAANAAIDTAKAGVDKVTGPMYEQAIADYTQGTARVSTDNINQVIDELIKDSPKGGPRAAQLNKWKKRIEEQGVDDLRLLQGVKIEMDDVLKRPVTSNKSLDSSLRRDTTLVKNALLKEMEDASPLYKQANEAFAEGIRNQVSPLRDGVIGVIAKEKDINAANVARRMFTDAATPLDIIKARRAIKTAEKADPELAGAWNGLTRQWLAIQFNKATQATVAGGTESNVAGRFVKNVFSNKNQRQLIKAAMGPKAAVELNHTMEALERIATTPLSASDTASFQLINQQLGESRAGVWRTIFSPREKALSAVEAREMDRIATMVAKALTDPSSAKDLKQLFKLKPSQERARLITGVLLGHVGAEEFRDLTDTGKDPRAPDQQRKTGTDLLTELSTGN